MAKFDYRGTTALVTGASSGIGKVFVEKLVERGVSRMILVARRSEVLRSIGDQLKGVQVDVVAEDLSVPGAFRNVADAVRALSATVDVLVNSAGFGTHGRLETQDETAVQQEVELNCSALVGLTTSFLPSMQANRKGAIVNVASTAGFQPLPYMAVYGATKAFVVSFSEALWWENRPRGVRVLALCPGATDTEFFDRVGTEDAAVGGREDPASVVETAFRALDRNRPTVISGLANTLMAESTRLAPRRMVVRFAAMAMQPKTRESR